MGLIRANSRENVFSPGIPSGNSGNVLKKSSFALPEFSITLYSSHSATTVVSQVTRVAVSLCSRMLRLPPPVCYSARTFLHPVRFFLRDLHVSTPQDTLYVSPLCREKMVLNDVALG
jgi:hypothetical protein